MSITPIVQVIENGPVNYVVHLACELTGGDTESAVDKIVVSTLPTLSYYNTKPVLLLALKRFRATTTNIAVRLLWAGTPNATLWSFPANYSGTHNFELTGPIQNNATLPTGDVLLSTDNYTDPALDGRYDLMLWFKKIYQ